MKKIKHRRRNIKNQVECLYIPIDNYGHIKRLLRDNGIVTIQDLCRRTSYDLTRLEGMTEDGVAAINMALYYCMLRPGMSDKEIEEYDHEFQSNKNG